MLGRALIQINDSRATLVKRSVFRKWTGGIHLKMRNMKRITSQIRKPFELLKARGWIWKVAIAGLCGSVTHTLLMLVKTKLGILEAFQPYQSLQIALSYWTGEYVHP